MELEQPFLKLPFVFDVALLATEVERVLPEHWLPHPSGLPGNTALPLVAINGEPRDGFDGQMAATQVLIDSPYLMQVVSSFGEVVARSRLMRLAPGAEVQEHVDFNYHWYSRGKNTCADNHRAVSAFFLWSGRSTHGRRRGLAVRLVASSPGRQW